MLSELSMPKVPHMNVFFMTGSEGEEILEMSVLSDSSIGNELS